MAQVEAGFPWASLAAGALCAAGLLTAETGVGICRHYPFQSGHQL